MSFQNKNNYTLYIKLDDNMSDNIKNYYIQLGMNSLTTEDSGVDMVVPSNHVFNTIGVHSIDHMISCMMIDNRTGFTSGYYMYPRSSIYKYPFMLTHSVGIIDSGYRGHITAKIRCFEPDIKIESGIRLFQICAPDLSPIDIKILNSNDILPVSQRGNNGFGSSGN